MSKYGVISGLYFPVFGMNTEIYGPEITPYVDTSHAVVINYRYKLTAEKLLNRLALPLRQNCY